MRLRILAFFGLFFLLNTPLQSWGGSPYFELGSSLGKLTELDRYFGFTSTGTSSNLGFCGSFSFYVPITSPRNFFHFDLGLQNRMYFVSSTNPDYDLSLVTTNVALRLEISRFYIGGGYGPFTLVSQNGPLKLRTNPNVTSFFVEGGLIWRVVPELQIVATYAQEYGIIPGETNRSPSPASEYGLRFRFPLSPYSTPGGGAADYDGFRYPFGFMK